MPFRLRPGSDISMSSAISATCATNSTALSAAADAARPASFHRLSLIFVVGHDDVQNGGLAGLNGFQRFP